MIADPMGDLNAAPGGSPANDMTNTKEVFDPLILQVNLARMDRIRAVMGIASGCVAGILGLTSYEGIVCFFAMHLFVSFTIWAWKMNFDLATYTKQSAVKYMMASLQPSALSFALFWTLFYGLVYLY